MNEETIRFVPFWFCLLPETKIVFVENAKASREFSEREEYFIT